MGIVQLALNRSRTLVVLALPIVVLGGTAISQMRTDIFPEIDLPVVTVLWMDKGMETSEVERCNTTYCKYAISSNVNGIRRMEPQTRKALGTTHVAPKASFAKGCTTLWPTRGARESPRAHFDFRG